MDEARSPFKAPGLDLLCVDSGDRKPTVAPLVDVHPSVDADHVLVPDRFGHRGVSSHDAAHSLDRSQVLMPGFPDVSLNEGEESGGTPGAASDRSIVIALEIQIRTAGESGT